MRIKISEDLAKKLKSLDNNAVNCLFVNNRKEILSPNPVVEIKSFKDKLGNNENGYVTVIKEDDRTLNIKLSRVFKHVFSKDFYGVLLSSDIEKANNDFISMCASHLFQVVNNVSFHYKEENYYGYDTDIQHDRVGPLWKSCMRNNMHNCGEFFDYNPSIKLLIKLKDHKVVGRALLWKNVKCGDIVFNFMDRIYTVFDYDVKAFKDWAKNNGYWQKEFQTYEDTTQFIDPHGKLHDLREAYVSIEDHDPYKYSDDKGIPYFDTFMYVNNTNTLSNNLTKSSCYEARDPEGCKIVLETARYRGTDTYLNTNYMSFISSKRIYVKTDEAIWVPSISAYEEIQDVTFLKGEPYRNSDVKFSDVYMDNIAVFESFYCEEAQSWVYKKDGVNVNGNLIYKGKASWSHAQQCYIDGCQSQPINQSNRSKTTDVIERKLYVELRKKYTNFKITTEFIHELMLFSFDEKIPFTSKIAIDYKPNRHLFFPPLFFVRAEQDLVHCSPGLFDKCYKPEYSDHKDWHLESFRQDMAWIKTKQDDFRETTPFLIFTDLANNRNLPLLNFEDKIDNLKTL